MIIDRQVPLEAKGGRNSKEEEIKSLFFWSDVIFALDFLTRNHVGGIIHVLGLGPIRRVSVGFFLPGGSEPLVGITPPPSIRFVPGSQLTWQFT